jgi:hypothetical protein
MKQWAKDNPLAVIVLVILIAIIIYLLVLYLKSQSQLEQERQGHGTYIVELEKEYKREKKILENTADELRSKLENVPSDSGAGVVPVYDYRTIYVRKPYDETTPEPVTIPASCEDCLPKIQFPYHFDNEYFWLRDTLRWNPQTRKLDGNDQQWGFTDNFNQALIEAGLKAAEEIDDRLWQPRLQIVVDSGVQDSEIDPITGVGVGIGAELLNLRGLTNLPVGVNVAVAIVPKAISQSHLLAGVEWRFFRNMAVGVAGGRSLMHNMVLIDLTVFPMD